MDTTLDELHAVILALPEGERARLAEKLLASLGEDTEVDKAWLDEARERLEAFRRGDISAVSSDEVLTKARRVIDG